MLHKNLGTPGRRPGRAIQGFGPVPSGTGQLRSLTVPRALRRCGLAGVLALLVLPVFGLDFNAELGVTASAAYRYANAAGPRFNTDLSLGQAVGDIVYLNLDFWNSAELGASASQWVLPRELEGTLSADFALGPINLGVLGILYAPTGGPTRTDLGAYVKGSFGIVGDIFSLDIGLRGLTDLGGFYGEARFGPSILLPTPLPIAISVQGRLGVMAGNYDNLSYSGLSHLSPQAKLSLILDKNCNLNVQGGYSFDLSGGRFPSYPFVGATVGIALSTPQPEPPAAEPDSESEPAPDDQPASE